MWQGSASVVSWSWEKFSCQSKLVSALSMLLLPVLSWTLITYNWAQVLEACDCLKLLSIDFDLCWCHWCCLLSAWSSRHWSPGHRLWRLCQDAPLNLPLLLPLLLSHLCHQQSGGWRLFCLQYWQCLHDLLRRVPWSFPEICWRGWVRVDTPVRLQL